MQGRGGRPDDSRGWEGRKQRREARADGSGASVPGSAASAGAGGELLGRGRAPAPGASAGARSDAAVRRGEESGDLGEKRRDEAGRVRILG